LILTNENYYSQEANREYFSVSQLKTFMDCEERAVAELDGMYERPLTTSLLVGSYVDAHFSRELDLFKAKNPQIFTKQGTLKSEFRQAEEIIARIERDRLAMALLSGKTQQIFTGEIFGEPFKVKLDVFLDHEQVEDIVDQFPLLDCLFFSHGAIVDMKIMKDFAPIYKEGAGRQNFIESWQYDLQGAIYQEIVRQNLGHRLPFLILGATKETVTDIDLFHVPQAIMDANLELLEPNLPRYAALKRKETMPERCGTCGWCKETKVLSSATWPEEFA